MTEEVISPSSYIWRIHIPQDIETTKGSYILPVVYRAGVLGGLNTPSPRNSEVLTKLSRISSAVENTTVTT
jgi:hypothetical protein